MPSRTRWEGRGARNYPFPSRGKKEEGVLGKGQGAKVCSFTELEIGLILGSFQEGKRWTRGFGGKKVNSEWHAALINQESAGMRSERVVIPNLLPNNRA